jgi:hypothetical protein
MAASYGFDLGRPAQNRCPGWLVQHCKRGLRMDEG